MPTNVRFICLLNLEEVSFPLVIDGRAETGNGVPAFNSRKAVVATGAVATVAESTAQRLVTDGHVVVGSLALGHCVEGRVGEANRALANTETLLVDAVENSSNDGSRHGRAARQAEAAAGSDQTVGADSGDIGEAASAAVVDAGVGGDVALRGVVGKVARVVAEEVVADDVVLPRGAREDVGEATAGGKGLGGRLGLIDGVNQSRADGGDVRAAAEIIGDEDVVVRALAVASAVGDTSVTAGNDSSDAHKTELHELIALALGHN